MLSFYSHLSIAVGSFSILLGISACSYNASPSAQDDSQVKVSTTASKKNSLPCSQRQAPSGWVPVRNIAELTAINNDPNASYLQLCDLDLQSVNWVPITVLRGVFDGNGFTISNLHNKAFPASFGAADTQDGFYALFLENLGIIRNVKINNINLNSTSQVGYMGGIAARNSIGGVIDGCDVSGNFVTWPFTAGGIVGINLGQVRNSNSSVGIRVISGNLNYPSGNIGGIAGSTGGSIENVRFSGSISVETLSTAIGGIVGLAMVTERSVQIAGAVNSGNISATGDSAGVGGIIGQFICQRATPAVPCELVNSFSSGNITGGYHVGGLIGYSGSSISGSLRVSNSGVTAGTIRGNFWVGGLMGTTDAPSISGSSVKGSIIADGDPDSYWVKSCDGLGIGPFSAVGGLVGQLNSLHSSWEAVSTITDSSFEGDIQSKLNIAGGIVGMTNRTFVIRRTQSKGRIRGNNFTGGFIGFVNGTDGMSNISDSSAQMDIDAIGYSGLFMGNGAFCRGGSLKIRNVFAAGNSSTLFPQIPPLLSQIDTASSFYLSTSDAPSNMLAGIAKTQTELRNFGTFVEWDMNRVWTLLSGGGSYPSLKR